MISIDLAEENKVCQQFGFINHENELTYLTSITQGVHLSYAQLMRIKHRIDEERGLSSLFRQPDPQRTHLTKNLFDKEAKFRFEIIDGHLKQVDKRPLDAQPAKPTSLPKSNNQTQLGLYSKRLRND